MSNEKLECQHMFVIRVDKDGETINKACCYNERDANVMVNMLGDGASWNKVPVACFHDARNREA